MEWVSWWKVVFWNVNICRKRLKLSQERIFYENAFYFWTFIVVLFLNITNELWFLVELLFLSFEDICLYSAKLCFTTIVIWGIAISPPVRCFIKEQELTTSKLNYLTLPQWNFVRRLEQVSHDVLKMVGIPRETKIPKREPT